MGEEKVEENATVNAVPSSVEKQQETGEISSATDNSVVLKRDREAGLDNDDVNANKKLKLDEDVKPSEVNANAEKDVPTEEQKLANAKNASNTDSDEASAASRIAGEEKENNQMEASVDSTVSEPTETVSSTTTFKGGFGSFVNSGFGAATSTSSTPSIFSSASNSATASAQANGTATTSAFSTATSAFKGGFSGFGTSSSFASEKKEKNLWTESKVLPKSTVKSIFSKEENASSGDSNQEEPAPSEELYVQLSAPLTEKKVETGEELEESTFSCRAKLYALDLTSTDKSWKERGVGTLHVNTFKEASQSSGAEDAEKAAKTTSRLVMRSDGLLRVVLNVPLLKSFEVFKGMKSSLQSEKFIRITAIEDGKPIQYALKTGNADTAERLYNSIQQLI